MLLRRMRDFLRQQNGARAGAENELVLLGKFPDGRLHPIFGEKLEHGRALAARHDERVGAGEILSALDEFPSRADAPEHLGVHLEIALHGQNAHGFVSVVHCELSVFSRQWSVVRCALIGRKSRVESAKSLRSTFDSGHLTRSSRRTTNN